MSDDSLVAVVFIIHSWSCWVNVSTGIASKAKHVLHTPSVPQVEHDLK